jgi:hypothetical protein
MPYKSERQDEVEVKNQRGRKKAKEDPLVASSHPPSPLTYALPKASAISHKTGTYAVTVPGQTNYRSR